MARLYRVIVALSDWVHLSLVVDDAVIALVTA